MSLSQNRRKKTILSILGGSDPPKAGPKLDIVALRQFDPLEYVGSFYFFGTSVKGEYGM